MNLLFGFEHAQDQRPFLNFSPGCSDLYLASQKILPRFGCKLAMSVHFGEGNSDQIKLMMIPGDYFKAQTIRWCWAGALQEIENWNVHPQDWPRSYTSCNRIDDLQSQRWEVRPLGIFVFFHGLCRRWIFDDLFEQIFDGFWGFCWCFIDVVWFVFWCILTDFVVAMYLEYIEFASGLVRVATECTATWCLTVSNLLNLSSTHFWNILKPILRSKEHSLVLVSSTDHRLFFWVLILPETSHFLLSRLDPKFFLSRLDPLFSAFRWELLVQWVAVFQPRPCALLPRSLWWAGPNARGGSLRPEKAE